MALGDGTAWDESNPAVTGLIADGANHILDVRKGVAIRLEKEHSELTSSSGGGEHLQGSAKVYVADEITGVDTVGGNALEDIINRPDGSTVLDDEDEGRLAYVKQNDALYIWSWGGASGEWHELRRSLPFIHLQDRGTGSSTITAKAWSIRPITTEVSDTCGLCTLGTNTFALAAGTYTIRVRAQSYKTDMCQLRLYNVTDASIVAYGQSQFAKEEESANITSELMFRFSITSAKTFRIEEYIQTKSSSYSFGLPMSQDGDYSGTSSYNVFMDVELIQEYPYIV